MKRIASKRLQFDAAMTDARGHTQDSFQNFAAKVGIGTDNMSTADSYGFNPISRVRTLIEWMYRGSWMCGVGVDVVADDMTREGIDISDEGLDPETIEKINGMFRSMQIWQSLNQVAKWSRLYGGALGILMIEGQRLDTPLRLETVKAGQFKGIVVCDRWMVTPDLMTAIRTPGPDFGNPEFYTIDAQSPNFPIPRQRLHASRCVRMEGVELPFWQKQSENMWGMSIFERLYDRLTAFDSTTQGTAQLTFRAYLRTLKVKNLRSIIAAGGKAFDGLIQNIYVIRKYQSNEGMTLIDAEDEMESQQYTFAGLSDVLAALGEQIAGALQVPIVRLFGQSPAGMNATGESDLRTYYDNVKRQQERWFRRPLDIIIPLVARNCNVEMPEGWKYEFVSLWQMTEKEKAEVNKSDSDAIVSVQGTGILPSAIALKELRASGRRTGRWQSITDDDIKEAEENDKIPSPEELGLIDPETGLPIPQPGGQTSASGAEKGKSVNPDKVAGKKAEDAMRLVDVQGIPIYVETHKGDVRRGGYNGSSWEVTMPADYGFIEGIGSAEGAFEQLDCYVGPDHDSDRVFIIDQTNLLTGGFDEHKVMLGFDDAEHARRAYIDAFTDGKGSNRLHAMIQMSVFGFKQWMKTADLKLPASVQ